MSQIHKWSLCVCFRWGFSVSQYADRWIKGIHSFKHHQRFNIQSQLFGGSSVSYMVSDSPRSWQVHLNQVLKSLNLSQMKSDPYTSTGMNSKGHLNLMVMAYVDDLIVSGEAQAVQEFIQEIQKTFSLKHVDYLTPDNPVEFLGRIIKVKKSEQINGVSSKAHRQFVRSLGSQREVNDKWGQDSAGLKGRSNSM